jgi:ABC-2 type transport system permease protein
MLQRTWAVMQKEFIQTLRDKSTLLLMLSVPLVQLLLFAYAVNMSVDHIPTIVADQSLDNASQAYVEALVNSGFFDVTGYVFDQAEVIRTIDQGQAQVGIVIPPDFSTHIERRDAQVLLLVDGSDLFTSQSAYNAATAVAEMHALEVLMQKVARSGKLEGRRRLLPLDALIRILYNPNLTDLWFVIPGMTAVLLQTQSIALTVAAVVREREVGTIEQILVTPIRPVELMLGKIAPNLIIAIINMLSIVALGVWGFGVPFQGNFWLFFWLALMYVFSGLGLGLLISTVSQNQSQAQQLTLMITLIGLVLGGYIFPRDTMPALLRLLGNLFPLTYFIPIARGIISKGVGVKFLWDQVAALLVYIIIIMGFASRAFKQGLD